MSQTDLGGGFWQRWGRRYSSPLAVYGLMVYTVLIGVVADHADDLGEVFVGTSLTQVVFFAAHVFAHTLGEHGERGLRQSFRHGVRHSAAMLYAPIPPALVLGVGALTRADADTTVDVALLTSTIVLAILGYFAYARRTPNIALRLAGALGTAVLGAAVMVIEYAVH